MTAKHLACSTVLQYHFVGLLWLGAVDSNTFRACYDSSTEDISVDNNFKAILTNIQLWSKQQQLQCCDKTVFVFSFFFMRTERVVLMECCYGVCRFCGVTAGLWAEVSVSSRLRAVRTAEKA